MKIKPVLEVVINITVTISSDKVIIKPDENERLRIEEMSNGDLVITKQQ